MWAPFGPVVYTLCQMLVHVECKSRACRACDVNLASGLCGELQALKWLMYLWRYEASALRLHSRSRRRRRHPTPL